MLAAGVLSLGLGGGPGPGASPSPQARAPGTGGVVSAVDQVESGRQLYLQSCASCHGEDGRGGPNGPSLQAAGPAHYDFYLRTGRMPLSGPGEPQYRQEQAFTEDQIRALVAFGTTLGQGPQIPPAQVTGANLQRGWELYIQNCASCHGTSGSGGAIGGGFVAPGLERADPVKVQEAMLVGPGAMPIFPLPQQDLDAVAAYVEFLRRAPAPGGLALAGTGAVPEGFIAGAVGLGLLVLIARWVARGREGPATDDGRSA